MWLLFILSVIILIWHVINLLEFCLNSNAYWPFVMVLVLILEDSEQCCYNENQANVGIAKITFWKRQAIPTGWVLK